MPVSYLRGFVPYPGGPHPHKTQLCLLENSARNGPMSFNLLGVCSVLNMPVFLRAHALPVAYSGKLGLCTAAHQHKSEHKAPLCMAMPAASWHSPGTTNGHERRFLGLESKGAGMCCSSPASPSRSRRNARSRACALVHTAGPAGKCT